MTLHLNQGHIAALLLALGLIIWMVSGSLTRNDTPVNARPLAVASGLPQVQAEHMSGEAVSRDILISGRTAAQRRVSLKAEIRATVTAIHKQKGEAVRAGELILELDPRDWPARVRQAEANMKQRRLEAESARKLAARGLANDAEVAQAETVLANAEAELTYARIQLSATRIRAPFDGIVDQRDVEKGDFVQEGNQLVTVLDFSPYLVTGQASETEAADIHIGDPAWAELINGERVHGHIRYIAAEADHNTRTFPLEIEISNPGGKMTSGLTAKIHIPQPPVQAYYISPALLILNDEGHLGLKGIDADNRVIFHSVRLLSADDKGIWVYGPGDEADIITIGGGFVEYGQQVQPVYRRDTDAPASSSVTPATAHAE
ncbi:MAG: efflux RND transporter periplasmic adaptor subunit [Pseudomonadota bacterium]|nr:efflux RND transporter periplasmic adaptor subunit [Pseudomonadota bacterium]